MTPTETFAATFDGLMRQIFKPRDLFGDTARIVPGLPLAQYLNARGVSNSLLKEFADCPLAALEYLSQRGRTPTAAMVMGSAVDCLLCEPETFSERFYLRPDEIDGVKWQGNRTVCKQWKRDHADKPILSSDELAEAGAMVQAIRDEPRAMKLLAEAEPQLSVFWQDKKTGLQMMGRPDFTMARTAGDLKCTNDASAEGFSKTLDNFGYHIQAALYADGLEANGRECNTFYFIAVQGGERPRVNVRRLKERALELGRAEYKKRLRELADCIERNEWPGYSGPGTEIQPIDLPAYAYSRMEGEVELIIGGKTHAL